MSLGSRIISFKLFWCYIDVDLSEKFVKIKKKEEEIN